MPADAEHAADLPSEATLRLVDLNVQLGPSDQQPVEDTIRDICARYDVREIAFDPHLARNMMANLAEDGFPAVDLTPDAPSPGG